MLNAPCVWKKKSHHGEVCHLQIIFQKLQRVRDPHLKMLLFEKSMCPSFDLELPWAETSELPFWKNISFSFTQLCNVLMVEFIPCSGKTSSDRGRKSVNLKDKKDRGLPFQALYSTEHINPHSFSR